MFGTFSHNKSTQNEYCHEFRLVFFKSEMIIFLDSQGSSGAC